MPTETKTSEYNALTQGGALQLRPESGVLRMTGNDRIDFLQRMTTNDIGKLKPGYSTVTVLTSPVARVLFVFTVICQEEALLLLPAAGETTTLGTHLRGQIFFMDNVKVEDAGQEFVRARLMGPEANAILTDAILADAMSAGSMITAVGISPPSSEEGAVAKHAGALFVSQQQYDLPGFELLLPRAQEQIWLDKLQAAGALLLEDDVAYTARRVELGRPLPGHEATEAYSPLEASLAWTCAEDKGCYTGQEIIARQITYDKVTKTLVGLRSQIELTAGDPVAHNGRTVGTVTSTAISPTLDAPIALAIIKRPQNEPGTMLAVGDASVEVVALPIVG